MENRRQTPTTWVHPDAENILRRAFNKGHRQMVLRDNRDALNRPRKADSGRKH